MPDTLLSLPAILTSSLARQILFASFFFSQGSTVLQEFLFHYIALRCPPDWHLPEDEADLVAALEVPIARYLQGGFHAPVGEEDGDTFLIREIATQYRTFRSALAQRTYHLPEVIDAISSLMISRERHHLCLLDGRFRSPQFQHPHHGFHPHLDPYFSAVCYYGLLGQPCGIHVFDALFADLRGYLQQAAAHLKKEVFVELLQVIEVWNQHHPCWPVPFPEVRP